VHDYSTNTDRSKPIPYLFAAAGLIGTVWSFLVKRVGWQEVHFLAAPSAIAAFGALYYTVDHWLWSVKVFGFSISPLPSLKGEWSVTIKPKQEAGEPARIIHGTAHIEQTWTQFQIQITVENGTAESLLAALDVKGTKPTLVYQYRYTPRGDAPDAKQEHQGIATLAVEHDGSRMEGPFYTGRGRRNIGQAIFVRKVPS
jgi:hypothetical protein